MVRKKHLKFPSVCPTPVLCSVAASPQRGPCAGPLSQQGIRYCTQSTLNDSISTQMTPDKQGKIDQSLARVIYSPGTPLSITANTQCRKFSNY